MSINSDPSKELRLMLAFFGDGDLPKIEEISAAAIPQPYRSLLVHNGHMTETLEKHHGADVDVHPYNIHHNGSMYGRKLDLTVQSSGEVVMTGILLFNLSFVEPVVRDEILAAETPLGRILVEHNVLREVTTETYLKVAAEDPLVARFGLSKPLDAYGRLATIFCNQRPAVDLLEIVRP
jgi:chorismate-pyruvate lyase